jgi:hypothetical protein
MRPEISEFPRLIYETYLDHPSVSTYPAVRGIFHNIYFLNHKHKEVGEDDDSSSKINMFEANFIVKLVGYLVMQKYSPGEITVLSMYLGQVQEIRK